MAVDVERIVIPQENPLAERLTELQTGETNLTVTDLESLVPLLLTSDKNVTVGAAQVGFVSDTQRPDDDPKLQIDIDDLTATKPITAHFTTVHMVVGNTQEGIATEELASTGAGLIMRKGLEGKLGGGKIENQFQTVLARMGIKGETRFHLGRVNGEPVLRVRQTIRR